MILLANAVPAVNVARLSRNSEGFAAIIPLHERDRFGAIGALIKRAAKRERAMQSKRDFCLHIGQFFLHELRCRNWFTKDNTLQSIIKRRVPTKLCGPHRAPAYPVTRFVQARKWPTQACHIRKDILLGYKAIIKSQLAGDGGAKAHLAFNLGGGEPFHAALDDKAANSAVQLGPNHRNICDR